MRMYLKRSSFINSDTRHDVCYWCLPISRWLTYQSQRSVCESSSDETEKVLSFEVAFRRQWISQIIFARRHGVCVCVCVCVCVLCALVYLRFFLFLCLTVELTAKSQQYDVFYKKIPDLVVLSTMRPVTNDMWQPWAYVGLLCFVYTRINNNSM